MLLFIFLFLYPYETIMQHEPTYGAPLKWDGFRETQSNRSWGSPHADEHVAIAEDEEQDVFLCDIVEVGALLIGEEQVGFPQAFEHLRVDGEGVRLEFGWEPKPGVVPPLPQEDVYPIILVKGRSFIINAIKNSTPWSDTLQK